MPSTFCFPRPRRVAAVGLLLGTTVAVGCGGASDAGNTAAADAPVPTADTATLSAKTVAIGGFTYDSARMVPWRSSVTVPGRLMLDPSSLETIGSITEGRITHVLVRVGVEVVVPPLALEPLPARTTDGRLVVDADHQTTVPRLFAAGDCTVEGSARYAAVAIGHGAQVARFVEELLARGP